MYAPADLMGSPTWQVGHTLMARTFWDRLSRTESPTLVSEVPQYQPGQVEDTRQRSESLFTLHTYLSLIRSQARSLGIARLPLPMMGEPRV